MRISDWSSDVCSSDLVPEGMPSILVHERLMAEDLLTGAIDVPPEGSVLPDSYDFERGETRAAVLARMQSAMRSYLAEAWKARASGIAVKSPQRSEEHTSELQSLMRISYAVFCLKKKTM